MIYMPEHRAAVKSSRWKGYVAEHIVVAEKEFGRALRDDEEVHHLDENKSNNSPSNLIILPKKSHTMLHKFFKHAGIIIKAKEIRRCEGCDAELASFQRRFCSKQCESKMHKSPLDHISIEQFKSDFKELKSYVRVGKKYGISDNGLKKWLLVKHNTNKELLINP